MADEFAGLITLFIHFFGAVDKNDLFPFLTPNPWLFAIFGHPKLAKNHKIIGETMVKTLKPLENQEKFGEFHLLHFIGK